MSGAAAKASKQWPTLVEAILLAAGLAMDSGDLGDLVDYLRDAADDLVERKATGRPAIFRLNLALDDDEPDLTQHLDGAESLEQTVKALNLARRLTYKYLLTPCESSSSHNPLAVQVLLGAEVGGVEHEITLHFCTESDCSGTPIPLGRLLRLKRKHAEAIARRSQQTSASA